MARYVVLEFDDNAAAKKFVEGVNEAFYAVEHDYKSRRVVGIFGKPTLYCECIGVTRGMRPFTRSPKAGWWVCADCMRPTEAWATSRSHWSSALGTNLLPGNGDIKPTGWGLLDKVNPAPIPTGQHEPDPALIRKAERRAIRSSQRKMNPRRG